MCVPVPPSARSSHSVGNPPATRDGMGCFNQSVRLGIDILVIVFAASFFVFFS